MDHSLKIELIAYLSGFISENRKARFDEVIANRTGHLRIVLEDVYQGHNASAVLRSCDCFGIQHVHFIENRNSLKVSDDVAMGSSNWLSIHRYANHENNTREALSNLKKEGYRIVATGFSEKAISIEELSVKDKLALVFGTEITGVSKDVLDNADELVTIPMFGFTGSFNVSVCAALCMYEIMNRVRQTVPGHQLSTEERTDVYLDWLKNSVEKSEALIENYLMKK